MLEIPVDVANRRNAKDKEWKDGQMLVMSVGNDGIGGAVVAEVDLTCGRAELYACIDGLHGGP